jgi:hypothetical protein
MRGGCPRQPLPMSVEAPSAVWSRLPTHAASHIPKSKSISELGALIWRKKNTRVGVT